jgi:4-carboxymuconolactone decarboxylase
MSTDRYNKGLETLEKTTGHTGKAVIDRLNKIHPSLGDCVIEFPNGDVLSRPGLDLKTRQIANVVALAAIGNALSFS